MTNLNKREQIVSITADTVSVGEFNVEIKGPSQVTLTGGMGGGAIAYHALTSQGRGPSVRPFTSIIESFESGVQNLEFVMTGSTTPTLVIVIVPLGS